MRRLRTPLLALALVVVVVSCGTGESDPAEFGEPRTPTQSTGTESTLPLFDHAGLTAGELAALEAIRERGVLRVATVVHPGAFEIGDDGQRRGFHYSLATELGRALGVDTEFAVVEFQQMFERDGAIPSDVRTNPEIRYVPDLFDRVDLYAFDLTINEWRKKLMRFIPLYPVRVLTVTVRGDEIRQLGDLHDRHAVVVANSAHVDLLASVRRRTGVSFEFSVVPFGADVYGMLRSGVADFTVRESNSLLTQLAENPDMTTSLPLGTLETNGWAVAPDNPGLAMLAERFVRRARSNGTLTRAWSATYGVQLDDYNDLIGYTDEARFTPEEIAYLGELRAAGPLRVATYDGRPMYAVSPDGVTYGLHYNLVLAVAEALELAVELVPVAFADFFAVDGVIPQRAATDPDFTYVPDLLRTVDVYAGTFTPLPWRQKFLRFVPVYPSRIVFVTVAGARITSPADLEGRVVSVLAGSSYEVWAERHAESLGFTALPVASNQETVASILEGRADATLADAVHAVAFRRDHPEILFFPAAEETEMLSWAVARDNDLLASILEKAIDDLKLSGAFGRIWERYYESPFLEYLSLVSQDTSS